MAVSSIPASKANAVMLLHADTRRHTHTCRHTSLQPTTPLPGWEQHFQCVRSSSRRPSHRPVLSWPGDVAWLLLDIPFCGGQLEQDLPSTPSASLGYFLSIPFGRCHDALGGQHRQRIMQQRVRRSKFFLEAVCGCRDYGSVAAAARIQTNKSTNTCAVSSFLPHINSFTN